MEKILELVTPKNTVLGAIALGACNFLVWLLITIELYSLVFMIYNLSILVGVVVAAAAILRMVKKEDKGLINIVVLSSALITVVFFGINYTPMRIFHAVVTGDFMSIMNSYNYLTSGNPTANIWTINIAIWASVIIAAYFAKVVLVDKKELTASGLQNDFGNATSFTKSAINKVASSIADKTQTNDAPTTNTSSTEEKVEDAN